ncbi:MAG: hypothetical protein IVW55_14800 [Chloroflexi bacterium]|nr:hypothetical protein [Chloroflexota bacterium]
MSTILTPAAPASKQNVERHIKNTNTATHTLRLAHLWAFIPFAIAWYLTSIDFIEPFDFWWNARSGQIMAQTGSFLGTDLLVWSPVRLPYSNPQWGSQLLSYWLYNLSPYLLLTVRTLIIIATVGIIFRMCIDRANSIKLAALTTTIAYATAWTNYGMRPQLFAFLPFITFYYILERKDSHPRWLPLLVPIILFWVNIHGSFFLGVALMGIYAFGTLLEKAGRAQGRKWLLSKAALWQALWLGAAALATLANPYLQGIYQYFFIATNDPIARALNVEWQTPTLSDGTGQLFYANLLIFLASAYFSKRRMRPTELLLIVAFGYLSLTSLRNVMWWGWIVAPIMAANFAAWAEARRANRAAKAEGQAAPDANAASADARTTHLLPLAPMKEITAFNWVIAALILGVPFLFTPLWRPYNPLVPASAKSALAPNSPTKVGDFLARANVPAPIFNYMEWGGYLEWALYPRYQMFIDGRFEARQIQVWKDYLSVSKGRADWQQTLDSYGVKTLVLNKDYQADLILFVAQSTTWHKAYEDKDAVVYTR